MTADATTADGPFVRAIAQRPADALPRLIYADWLDEHGRAAEAAWLRADVRLAAAYPRTDADDVRAVQTARPPAGVPSLWLAGAAREVALTVAALFVATGRSLAAALRALGGDR